MIRQTELSKPPVSDIPNGLSIDVEEHFQVHAFEKVIDRSQWDHYPSRVVTNTRRILRLLADYGLEIGAGLGALAGKVWRIGLMGTSCSPRHVTLCLAALEGALTAAGASIRAGAGLEAAREVLFAA